MVYIVMSIDWLLIYYFFNNLSNITTSFSFQVMNILINLLFLKNRYQNVIHKISNFRILFSIHASQVAKHFISTTILTILIYTKKIPASLISLESNTSSYPCFGSSGRIISQMLSSIRLVSLSFLSPIGVITKQFTVYPLSVWI